MKKILCSIFMLLSLVFVLASCTKSHTLTLYDNDGTTVLNTVKVEDGKAPVKPADPTKEGYSFDGWFITPTNKTAYDFSKVLTEDAKAYARWTDNSYTDTRDWVLCGDINSWGNNLVGFHMTKKTGTNNVYELTLDLEAETQFQLTVLNEDGSFTYSTEGARAASQMLVDSEAYAEGAGGLGTYSNISIKVSGNYTITLTSAAQTDSNRVKLTRNGDVTPKDTNEEVVTVYIKGSQITNWCDVFTPNTVFTEKSAGVYELTVFLQENDEFLFIKNTKVGEASPTQVYYKVSNIADGSTDKLGGASNIKALATGTYKFTIDTTATKQVSATFEASDLVACDYYLDGTVLGGNWGAYQTNKAKYQLVKNGSDYQLTADLNADEELVIRAYAKDTETLTWDNILAAYNSEFLASNVGFGPVSKSNKNVKVAESGTYVITFNEYTKFLTIAKDGKDVYIKGGMNGWDHAFSTDYKFTQNADGDYELTLAFEENWECGLAVYSIGETTGYGAWVGLDKLGTEGTANSVFSQASGNLKCKTAGTYKVVYNYKTGVINFYTVE